MLDFSVYLAVRIFFCYICHMRKLKIEYIATELLVPFAQNAREHSEKQIIEICESIKEFGFNDPVGIDEANGIIEGHGRIMAASELGMKEVPCVRLSHMSERQRRAYILAHNKIALSSSWDFKKLSDEFNYLVESEYDLGVTGFGEDEIDLLLKADVSILPDNFAGPESIVAEHKRKGKKEKVKLKRWSVMIEADSKDQARDILNDMTDKGFKCLIVENEND